MSQNEPPVIEYAPNKESPDSAGGRSVARSAAFLLIACDLARLAIFIYLIKTSGNAYDFGMYAAYVVGCGSLLLFLLSAIGMVISKGTHLKRYKLFFAVHAMLDVCIFLLLAQGGGKTLWNFIEAL